MNGIAQFGLNGVPTQSESSKILVHKHCLLPEAVLQRGDTIL